MIYATTKWMFRESDPSRVRQISQRFGIDPVVAQILVQRGLDEASRVENFLFPDIKRLSDPEGIPGIDKAAELISEAIRHGRTIVIYGDYDVDGVCGLTILSECLRLAGAACVIPYIPHRIEEGYGLNTDAVRQIAEDHPGALLVSVDCGITAVSQVAEARSLGLDVVITDHHTFHEPLPDANVLVHPQLPDSDPRTATLCGAGVAFKLAWQIAKSFGDGKKASPTMREYLLRTMGLVALATVADVMPLVDENRILVKHGINSLNSRRSVGLEALMQFSGVRSDRPVDSGMIGFQIGPRINAAGRMLHAHTAYQLLTTNSRDEALELAETLEQTNRTRREIEAEIVRQARAQFESDPTAAQRSVVVVSDPGWHLGVVGIAASRLVELFQRPTVVLSIQQNGMAHGSARSITGLNLVEALGDCRDYLTTFGGHAAAAGLKLPGEKIADFRNALDTAVASRRTTTLGQRELWIDSEIPISLLNLDLVNSIKNLEPHGHGNDRPVFASMGLELLGEPQIMGKEGAHLRLNFRQGNHLIKTVAWGRADLAEKLEPGVKYDLAYTTSINEWKGRVEIQTELRDIRNTDFGISGADT